MACVLVASKFNVEFDKLTKSFLFFHPPTTTISSRKIIIPTIKPAGILFIKPSLLVFFVICSEIFSIITIKRNKTATAPTYTISIIIPKNSAPIKINKIETLTNTSIKKKTEFTVFLEMVTITAAKTVIREKK